jgi:hypothetical protein
MKITGNDHTTRRQTNLLQDGIGRHRLGSAFEQNVQRESAEDIRGRTFRWRPPGCDAAAHSMEREDYGLPRDVIREGIAISGLFDLRPLRFSWLQPMLQLTEDIVQTQSPLLRLPDCAPPLCVSVGGAESSELRRQSADYLHAWKAAGLRGWSVEQPEANHFMEQWGFY